MRLSKQLFASNMKKPLDFSDRKTSSLLEDGIFTYFRDPGIPFYLPHGKQVLTKLQNIFLEESKKEDFSHIEIPGIMKDKVLEEGEDITENFNEKIIQLKNDVLEGYHFLTTPEPMLIDLASISLNTFNQLPVRFVYNVDILRGIQKPKGILKGRQFKVFMGTSLDEDEVSLEESLRLFEQVSDNILNRLEIVFYKRKNTNGINVEHFYLGIEGENFLIPEINHSKKVRALSLSMNYHYNPKKELKARFRNKQNENSRVLYGTYGLGTQRVLYALFDSHKDKRGFKLPIEVAPFQFSIIPVKYNDQECAERVYQLIKDKSQLDDRINLFFGERVAFSDYVGIPWKIIYGDKIYTLKSRDEDIQKTFSDVEGLIAYLKKEIK